MTKKSQNLTSIRSLSKEALRQKETELYREIQKGRHEVAVQKGPKDVHSISKKRKELAQVKTVLTQLDKKEVKEN